MSELRSRLIKLSNDHTGTGKTFTMEGNLDNQADHGVIPRSTGAIFHSLKNEEIISYRVACSYLEIYNEELCDLLIEDSNERQKLDIMNKQNGTFCRYVPIFCVT